MPRNPCIEHPDHMIKKVKSGMLYCERCHHFIEPKYEIVDIVQEEPLEAETVEETEAVVEAPKEALEPEIEVKEPLEESPEETAPAEVVEPIEEEAVVEAPEVEAEVDKPTVNVLSGDIDVGLYEDEIETQKAKIEALKAKLAELE